MCFGISVMNVEHKYGNHHGKRHEYHREQEVLANQRNHERRRRNDFCDDQQKNSQCQENRDAKCNLNYN